ncbi:hypothetical protein AZE42_07163 [Rhizopogon vesiculosus]|uniref:Uncharacterized protein n=1 Tax=Rhizopogon vesiculosus TaxID=180088 RepID=A0A1J8Q8I3_9AGAM|nr:hypothetical protein AZE42_07163 [Rhizopogon vesiculosus]
MAMLHQINWCSSKWFLEHRQSADIYLAIKQFGDVHVGVP